MSRLVEHEDYYFNENGLMVFTSAYLFKRGFCCKNGCLNCPYGTEFPSMQSKDYIKVSIQIEPVEEGRSIAAAALSELEYEMFEDTEQGVDAYVQGHLFNRDVLKQHWLFGLDAFNISFTDEIVKGENWNQKWEENFHPIWAIENKLRIRAPFHKPNAAVDEIIIMPKMAFGTGQHATTATMCSVMSKLDFKGKNVLDFGSGTALLAIYAEKLGASKVIAIDYDEWCFTNGLENVALNNCSNVEVLRGEWQDVPKEFQFEILLANINLNIHKQNFKDYFKRLPKGGTLLLSGVLTTDESEIRQMSEDVGFTWLDMVSKGEWMVVTLKKS